MYCRNVNLEKLLLPFEFASDQLQQIHYKHVQACTRWHGSAFQPSTNGLFFDVKDYKYCDIVIGNQYILCVSCS